MEKTMNPFEEPEQTLLSKRETENPNQVIVTLFDFFSLEYLRVELWEYLKSAISDNSYSFRGSPGMVIKLQRELERLIEALSLRLKRKEDANGEVVLTMHPAGSDERIEEECNYMNYLYPVINTYKGRIKRLSREEIRDPYLALKKIFQVHSPDEWKKLLNNWSKYALERVSILSYGSDNHFLQEFEQLEKLLEVAHLFNMETEHYDDHRELSTDETGSSPVTESADCPVSKELINEFQEFFEYVPPAQLNRDLRKMLLQYFQYCKGEVPSHFDKLLADLNWFMELLDKAEDECKGQA